MKDKKPIKSDFQKKKMRAMEMRIACLGKESLAELKDECYLLLEVVDKRLAFVSLLDKMRNSL